MYSFKHEQPTLKTEDEYQLFFLQKFLGKQVPGESHHTNEFYITFFESEVAVFHSVNDCDIHHCGI